MTQEVLHSEPARVEANGIEIVYDTFGEADAPAMLLVSGLGMQMIGWDEEFCAQLADRGYQVIRFDNRDVGLSTKFDEVDAPDVLPVMLGHVQPEALGAPYTLRDMADDAVGLLDALGIASAHVVGISMGGMIAQTMAIHHPERVTTLTSIMSSTGAPDLPPPTPEAMQALLAPAPEGRDDYIERSVQDRGVFDGPGYPTGETWARECAERRFDRGLHPAGFGRQLAAIVASGSRREPLQSVTVPTLVIHGDADPLVPVEGGIDTAEAIPGAELLIIEGMGHALPPSLWPEIIEAVAGHAV
jgi:pimeloyl-ACP methyl ester carboxylesterase